VTLFLPVVQLHMLLHLEELQQEVDVCSCDMHGAELKGSGKYLMLEVRDVFQHRQHAPIQHCADGWTALHA
jgi:hypothetical protein